MIPILAHENGSIESPHGYFKNRLHQALLLRGSCDFDTTADYQGFILQVIEVLNGKVCQKFTEEQPYLHSLPEHRYPDYEILSVKVTRQSTITVRCKTLHCAVTVDWSAFDNPFAPRPTNWPCWNYGSSRVTSYPCI